MRCNNQISRSFRSASIRSFTSRLLRTNNPIRRLRAEKAMPVISLLGAAFPD